MNAPLQIKPKLEPEDLELLGKLVPQLKRHEGFSARVYHDTRGYPTIGYGVNLVFGISEEEGTYLMKNRMISAMQSAYERYDWFKTLSPARKSVIVDMIYNLGTLGFGGFKGMHKAIKEGDFDLAGKEMLDSVWATQVKKRAHTLYNIWMTDLWPE